MKIRCGSHQQNRSIVRPGLSLMATKVALTAEEFRENSQRSIALFNTEKLSTNSTHVLKSAYCNSVHFCSCNLHGACGGKVRSAVYRARSLPVAICTGRVEAKFQFISAAPLHNVAICTGRVEAKPQSPLVTSVSRSLQSARGVWRQRWCRANGSHRPFVAICTGRVEAKCRCGCPLTNATVAICTGRVEAKKSRKDGFTMYKTVAICTGRVEAKTFV